LTFKSILNLKILKLKNNGHLKFEFYVEVCVLANHKIQNQFDSCGATTKKESERKERMRKKNDDNIVRLESENTEQQKEKFIQIHLQQRFYSYLTKNIYTLLLLFF
jgi:hypothetical protein